MEAFAIRTGHADRLERVREKMRTAGIDLLAVPPSDDLSWLLGASPTADERLCIFLVGRHADVFVVPFVNAEQCRSFAPTSDVLSWEDEQGPQSVLRGALLELLDDAQATIAVGDDTPARSLLLLQSIAPGAGYVSGARVLAPLREIKDAQELALIEASARTADAAMRAALEACTAGRSELEIAEQATAAFHRAGAQEVQFITVAAGPHGAFPHHHSGTRPMQAGEAVVIDLGGARDGYSSDLTRMAFIGEPDARYRETHAIVEAAVSAGIAAVRAGVTCQHVDRLTRAVIEDAGLGEFFVHRTGHGLGVSGHEPPWVVEGNETLLQAGMVISVEPGVYFRGEFGLRLEEIVEVTETGCVVLSQLARDVHVAG